MDQVKMQLWAAKQEIHTIFFVLPPHKQMPFITQTRELAREQEVRQHIRPLQSDPSAIASGKKLSIATLKSLERREKKRHGSSPAFVAKVPQRPHVSLTPPVSKTTSVKKKVSTSMSASPKARRRTYLLNCPSKLINTGKKKTT
eukprot:m.65669 g.65669  ORF g.65669 m.65669 type:complete len:144 (+) comp35325_c0_seq1:614-1045(+)